MQRFRLIVLLFSVLLLCSCSVGDNSSESSISQNVTTSETRYSDKEKAAIEVGEYFLENYNNQSFSKEDTYYINNEISSHLDSSIVSKCKDNEFYWVSFYDEHTVFIYKGAYFQTAMGYLVTDGTAPAGVAEKSEEFGFDKNSMEISKTISDQLYSIRAGL